MADERIKLLLDLGMSAENARQVITELDRLGTSAKQTAGDLRQLETHTVAVGMAGTQAMGEKSASGRGILGFSYAFQDFTSVITGGGGIARAMGSISNNIDQMAMAAGATVKQAAAMSLGFTALTAVIPIIQSVWESLAGGEAAKEAEEKIDKLHKKIEQTAEAFRKLRGAPTEAETEAAKGITEFLGTRPAAERAEAAIMAAQGPGMGREGLAPQEQAELDKAGREAGISDEQIEIVARRAIRSPASAVADVAEARRAAQEARQRAQVRQQALLEQGRRQRAAGIIQQAQVAGLEGEQARQELFGAARGVPGLGGLAELTPDAIEAKAERRRLTEIENKQNERIATANAEAAQKKREADNRQAEAMNRQAQANESARRDKDARDKEKAAREADRALEQEAMGAGVSEKAIRHERATGMAEQLVGQGANIVGQAFGPQAAMRASTMGTGEIEAVKQQTIRNLEANDLPFDALQKAFMEVVQAIDRQGQAAQRFAGQMNGMTGRMQSSPWPSGLQR